MAVASYILCILSALLFGIWFTLNLYERGNK